MKGVNIRVTTIVTHLCEGRDYFGSNVLWFEWMEYGLSCRGRKKPNFHFRSVVCNRTDERTFGSPRSRSELWNYF